MFSKACQYGVKALIYITLSSEKGRRVRVGEVADAIDGPQAFVAKVLQKLARCGIVNSVKGPYGGFEISAEAMKSVKLIDIVRAIDGLDIETQCGLGLKECSHDNPCPIHFNYMGIKTKVLRMLSSTSLHDLAYDTARGAAILK